MAVSSSLREELWTLISLQLANISRPSELHWDLFSSRLVEVLCYNALIKSSILSLHSFLHLGILMVPQRCSETGPTDDCSCKFISCHL